MTPPTTKTKPKDYTLSASAIAVLEALTKNSDAQIVLYPASKPSVAVGGSAPKCTWTIFDMLRSRELIAIEDPNGYPVRYRISGRGRLALALARLLATHDLSTADALILRDLSLRGSELHYDSISGQRNLWRDWDDEQGRHHHEAIRKGILFTVFTHLMRQEVIRRGQSQPRISGGITLYYCSDAGRAVGQAVQALEALDVHPAHPVE